MQLHWHAALLLRLAGLGIDVCALVLPETVALALAGALAASPPPVILVKTFMYSRIAHNLSFFLMDYISAIPRTTFFSTGLVASFLMAGVLVM